jgi:hypothetical protein
MAYAATSAINLKGWPTATPLFIIGVSFGIRLFLSVTHAGYLGVDGGAYLLSVNQVLGDEPTQQGWLRPLLAPGWTLVPFVGIWGPDVGYKIWSAVGATLPLFGLWLIVQSFLPRAGVVFVLTFFAFDLFHAEMLVTGALPLVAFTLLMVSLWAVRSFCERRQWWIGAILALSVGLIPHVNQTAAGITFLILPLFTVSYLRYAKKPMKPLVPYALAGALLGCSALPWFLGVTPGSGLLRYPGPIIYLVDWASSAWWQVVLGFGVGIWGIKTRQPFVQALGTTCLAVSCLIPFLSYDESIINVFYRSRYLLPFLWWPLLGALLWTTKPWDHIGKAYPMFGFWIVAYLGAGALSLLVAGYFWTFHNQARYSDMVTPATAEAIQQLDGPTITNTFGMAYWVAALTKTYSPHTWTAEPPRHFTEEYQHVRCVLNWVPQCDYVASAAALNVRYVLVDKRFPYYNDRAPDIFLAPPNPWAVTSQADWLALVFERDTTMLWEIR